MEPFLGKLIRYQELALEIAAATARIEAIPVELAAIDQDQEAARIIIKQAKERHEGSLKNRRELERQLKDFETKVDKYNDQSREVKTNEQYRAIMAEIQAVKDHIGEVEEKILLSMDDDDALLREIAEAERQVAARKPEFEARRKVLSDELAGLEAGRARLLSEIEALRASISPEHMEAYTRVSRLRGDRSLASIQEERCSGCGVRLRPALMVEVRKNDALHQCESCRRILFWIPPPPESQAPGTQPGDAGTQGTATGGAGEDAPSAGTSC